MEDAKRCTNEFPRKQMEAPSEKKGNANSKPSINKYKIGQLLKIDYSRVTSRGIFSISRKHALLSFRHECEIAIYNLNNNISSNSGTI